MINFVNIKEKLPKEDVSVLTWDGYSYKVEQLCWFEGENDEIPVFISDSGSNRNVILWAQLPLRPERLSPETPKGEAIV